MSNFEERDLVLYKTPDSFELSSRDDENQNLQLCQLSKDKDLVKKNSDFDTNFETLSPIFIRKILKSSKRKIYTNHFLLIAMVEYICNLLNSNRQKSVNYDFNEICKQLVQLGLFDSMLATDFFRPIRFEYLKFLHAIFNKTIPTQLHLTNKRSKAISNVLYNENANQKKSKQISNLNSSKVKKQENLSHKYSYQYFYNLSRYKTDFEEIEKLASGGFGSVYKAKNIIDQKMYAIKKIYFKNTDQSFCQRVIRETELLATLDHENIVNYNSSWIELDYVSKCNQNNRKESIDYLNESKSWSDVKFEPSSQSNKSKGADQFYTDFKNKHLSSSEDDHKDENEHLQEFNMQNSIVLYIQMKLCDFTLKEWIQSRNESIFTMNLAINHELNLNIFRQILSGVEYLHSQDIIHRDLKPGNIFMIKDTFQIKIGDFGLACLNILNAKKEKSTDINPRRFDHTKGVGTTLYASPEQLNGKIYDLKTDIYSLGIILFELFCPFNTEMERITLIRELKVDRKLPQNMKNELIDVCAFIEKMLSSKPIDRPSAHIILNSQLFMTKDQVIEQLQKLLEEKKNEIHKLKNLIVEKDEQLKEKEKIITKFKEFL